MRAALWILGCWFLVAGCGRPELGVARQDVVYGVDDRREVYEHPSAPHRAIAGSAIAMEMDEGWLDERNPSNVRITYTRTLGEANDLCPGERYASQIEPGTCSGTLIDARHVLTAAHCVDEASDCDGSTVWVFGFGYLTGATLSPLTRDDVYRCSRVLAFRNDGSVDHAVVELDRAVVGHPPAPVAALTGPLAEGTPLTLIGHPNGLPMKIASGGEVLSTRTDTLNASVDAFSGNSGSGVFDARGELVAILDSGADDYVPRGGCNVVNVLDPATESGEGLTYARPAIAALCATPGVVSALCGCASPPCTVTPVEGDTCADAVALPATSSSSAVSLVGYADDTTGSCGGMGADRVYTLTLEATATVRAEALGGDPVLYVRAGCEGAELACNDDTSSSDRDARVELDLEPGTYALFLDSYDEETSDATLTVTITYAMAPDAGAGDDAGMPVGEDAGTAPRPMPPSGCACGASGRGGADALWWLIALTLVAGGRRARRARRGCPGAMRYLFCALLFVPACTTPIVVRDVGTGSSSIDAGRDSAMAQDAGLDAGTPDGGAVDAMDAPALDATGSSCGGRTMQPCLGAQICVYALADRCGAFDATGTCQDRPVMCTRDLAPVCGCDGVTYDNECEARRAGTSARSNGECVHLCDDDAVTCGTARPSCMPGVTTPAVIDGCWGPCVAIETCSCVVRSDCPNEADRCNLATMRCDPR